MDNVNAIRLMIRRIVFSNTAAALITWNQVIESVDELLILGNERGRKKFKVINRPWGTDTNNNPDPNHKILFKAK